MDNSVDGVLKQVIKTVLLICCFLSVIFWITSYRHLIAGLVFGSVIGCLNFFLMARELVKTTQLVQETGDSKKSRKIVFGYFMRYAILALSFIIVGKSQYFAVIPFVIGLMLVQITIYLQYSWRDNGTNK